VIGKLLLTIFASVGVVLVAFNIYAVREVVLEILTFQVSEELYISLNQFDTYDAVSLLPISRVNLE
jgi:hypothetical protein